MGQDQKWGTVLRARRRMITITRWTQNIETKNQTGGRGKITGWNAGMSNRLRKYAENFRQDFRVLGTLTYPETYPRDGATVKGHFRAFVERLRRTGWLEGNALIWVIEFQARGAPHFHFIATNQIHFNWVGRAWAEITGGNPTACSRMEWIKKADSAGAYLAKYLGKDDQKAVPEGFKSIGRMWGIIAKKNLHGVPRVPVEDAAIENALPSDIINQIKHCKDKFNVRVSKTLNGFVLYGSKEGIKTSWHYLKESIATTVRTERNQEKSNLRTLADSCFTQEMQERQTKPCVWPFGRKILTSIAAAEIATANVWR